ncbi:MAG TPA: hypothetical protein VIN08_13270 [Ohtaekwangia sp.]|uniref:tellurite resistance TerB family protein n=1 Tax=Ohtaekwangia sp. TaxID=2066019 RepID=UPI002F9278AA
MTTFFEHQRTSYKRNYLRNLICLASSDGQLDDEEKRLIQKIGQKRGLKEWQISQLIEDPGSCELFLPESVSNRMNLLYDLMQIIYADSLVNNHEIEFMVSIVEAFKLHPEIVTQLMKLFQNNAPSPSEWKEFVEFVCEDAERDNS